MYSSPFWNFLPKLPSPLMGEGWGEGENLTFHGGETGSTGVRKLKLHTEVPPGLVKKVGLNTNADDYAYAVAA